MITDPTHQLRIGDFDLIGRTPQGAFTIKTQGDDATWGNPVAVTRTLKGLLQDGARIALDSWDLREAFLRVTIEAPTGDGLAAGEEALFAELGKRNVLVWTPPQQFGAPTVFEVEWSELSHEFDDIDELMHRRTYGIRFDCQPFARSLTETVTEVAAPPPLTPPVVVTVDDCTSLAGWSRSATGSALASTGGYVRARWATLGADARLFRTGAVSMTDTPYLRVEVESFLHETSHTWSSRGVYIDGVLHYPIYTETISASRWVFWFHRPDDFSEISWRGKLVRAVGWDFTRPGWYGELRVYDIKRADRIVTGAATGNMVSRTLPIGGSARTTASIQISSATTGLGDLLVHTSPTAGGMLSLESRLFSPAAGTPASGYISGTSKPLGTTPVSYYLPVAALDADAGTGYLLIARLAREGTGAVTANVKADMFAVTVGEPQILRVSPPSMPTLGFVTLGALVLPPAALGADGGIWIDVTLASPTGSPTLDDLWVVNVETGALTWVRCGTGAPFLGTGVSTRVWIDSPTVENPLPQVWRGTLEDRSDAFAAEPLSWMRHEYAPGDLHVTALSSGAADLAIWKSEFKRWHTHARD